MAARGEVVVAKRRLGFGASGSTERFVVVQSDALNEVLETTLVVPLDAAFAYYAGYPGAVRVTAAEAGTAKEHVAIVTALAAVDVSRFESAPVASLDAATLAEVDRMLAVVLEL